MCNEIINLSILPITFLAVVDKEKTITVPFYVKIEYNKRYLIEIENLDTNFTYTRVEKIKDTGKVKKIRLGQRSSIVSPGHKLKVTIMHYNENKLYNLMINQVEEQPLSNTLYVTMLYFDKNVNQLTSESLEILKLDENKKEILQKIEEIEDLSQPYKWIDIRNYDDYVIMRYVGKKRLLSELELQQGALKTKKIVPYILTIKIHPQLLQFLTHPRFLNKVSSFLEQSKYITQYAPYHLRNLQRALLLIIKGIITKQDYLWKKRNSLFDVLFLAKVPANYQYIVQVLSKMFAEGREYVTIKEFLSRLSNEKKERTELRTIRAGLTWLIKEEVITPGRVENENVIFVR